MEEYIFCLISYLNSRCSYYCDARKKLDRISNHRIEIIEKLRKYQSWYKSKNQFTKKNFKNLSKGQLLPIKKKSYSSSIFHLYKLHTVSILYTIYAENGEKHNVLKKIARINCAFEWRFFNGIPLKLQKRVSRFQRNVQYRTKSQFRNKPDIT